MQASHARCDARPHAQFDQAGRESEDQRRGARELGGLGSTVKKRTDGEADTEADRATQRAHRGHSPKRHVDPCSKEGNRPNLRAQVARIATRALAVSSQNLDPAEPLDQLGHAVAPPEPTSTAAPSAFPSARP